MPSPIALRYIGAGLLIVVGAVVLGISAHVEHESRTIVGLSTATFTSDAVFGGWTILVEVLLAASRFLKPDAVTSTIMVDICALFVTFVMWLVAGINTTLFTEDGRSVCKHLDDLFDLPEFENVDPAILTSAHNILKDACSELHAELAFIWIAFVVATVLLGLMVMQALRMRSRGIPNVWWKTLRHSEHVNSTAQSNPFADPQPLGGR